MANAFIVAIIVLLPIFANAQIVITEIMYDLREGSDSGREWIEVFNAGTAAIDLSTWRLFENGTNHKISAAGSATVAPGTYAVVADNPAKFKADWAESGGLLFDSAFSLSNEGETIVLRNGAQDIDSAVFAKTDGGDGTGDSLQRNAAGAVFEAGMPTPGAGIPAGGLQKSPPKSSQSAAKKEAAPAADIEILGAPSEKAVAAPIMLTAGAASPSWYWWLAPFLFASIGSGGIIAARHFRKDEWDIIEELDETG